MNCRPMGNNILSIVINELYSFDVNVNDEHDLCDAFRVKC